MPMQTIQLASGTIIHAKAFCSRRTYAGLLIGTPSPQLNAQLLEGVAAYMQPLWGENVPVHVVPPEMENADGIAQLPAWTNWVLLEARHKHECLAMVWFSGDAAASALHARIEGAVRHLPWDQLAREFEP